VSANGLVRRGTRLPHVTLAGTRAFVVSMAPLDEQRRIVARVEEQLSAVDALRAAIERARRRSASLCRAVLERAFRGELVPQGPADEPEHAPPPEPRGAGGHAHGARSS